jgi:outer membrane immunogenic protein
MKRLALAISVLAVTATGALANPASNWTGFYLGGNVGDSWGRSASTLWFTDAGTTVRSERPSMAVVGGVGRVWPTIAERSSPWGR